MYILTTINTMPVTKTAKRALRVSKVKAKVNNNILAKLEVALREAKKTKSPAKIATAMSYADRAAKKNTIHKNKAARIKASLSKLIATPKAAKVSKPTKTKTSKSKKN